MKTRRVTSQRQQTRLWLVTSVTFILVVSMIVLAPTLSLKPVSSAVLPRKEQFGRQTDATAGIPAIEGEERSNNSETNATRSSWSVLSHDISAGRPFHVMLTARDRKGNRRRSGGDFFNAVLGSERTNSTAASVSGEIKDFFNGSYLITFLPPWSGNATVHIKLWLTSALVKLARDTVDVNYIFLCAFGDSHGVHVDYVGPPSRKMLLPTVEAAWKHKRGGVGMCHMDWQPQLPLSRKRSCRMVFPGNHHWYGICETPSSNMSKACDSLQWCVYDRRMARSNLRERAVASENIGVVSGDVASVMISKRHDNVEETSNKEPCQPHTYVKASGHWLGKEWINRNCSFHCNVKEKWWKCLTNRDVYFIGDSTIRQLFALLLSSVGIKVPPTKPQFIPSNLTNTFVERYNATIRYRLHGLPVMINLAINFSDATFSADIIDAIPGNGNEILVLTMIHHFTVLPPEAFRLRLQQIVAALRRLRERNFGGKIPIVFRTANPRAFDSLRLNAYRIKWYNEIAIEIFTFSKLGVIVYDIFDMVAASPDAELVHQTDTVMSVQLSHILSLICYD